MTAPDTSKSATAAPPKLIPWAVGAAALLVVAGAGLFYYATQVATGPERGKEQFKVTVGAKACTPMDLTVSAGRVTFEIHNASDRPVEWEILDGVMVIEERENIAPGYFSTLTANLKPGIFAITCGLLSNPRGKLTVLPSAASEAEKARPPLKAFIGPLSEFKVYLALQSSALVRETQKLADAIKTGDLAAAKAQYLAARLPYKRIEAAAGRMADLENVIDPVADYLEKRTEDPGFVGFHRIEYGLFAHDSLDGLTPVAEKLVADVSALKDRLRGVKLAPEDLAVTAERQARRLSETSVIIGESRYAHSDLAELSANLEGLEKSVMLIDDLAVGAAPDVANTIKARFAAVKAEMASLKQSDADLSYDRVDVAQRKKLATSFVALADAIAKLNHALGLE